MGALNQTRAFSDRTRRLFSGGLPPPPADTQTELMAAIRAGSTALRKVEPAGQGKKPPSLLPAAAGDPGAAMLGVSIAAILKRRAAIAADSDDSDNEDEWED